MWTIARIDEADYGCEERLPGEPLMALVTIESDDGRRCSFECPEEWLLNEGVGESDEWPEDLDEIDAEQERANHMNEWMEYYYEAVAEMEETE